VAGFGGHVEAVLGEDSLRRHPVRRLCQRPVEVEEHSSGRHWWILPDEPERRGVLRRLAVETGATKDELQDAVRDSTLAKARLIGTYARASS
jgi:hypothetical protein